MKKPAIAILIFFSGILITYAFYTGISGKVPVPSLKETPAGSPGSITPEEPGSVLPPQQALPGEAHGEVQSERVRTGEVLTDTAQSGGKEYYVQAGSWKDADVARLTLEEIQKYYPGAYIERQNKFSKIRIPNIFDKKQGADIVRDLEEKLKLSPLLVLKTSKRDIAGASEKKGGSAAVENRPAFALEQEHVPESAETVHKNAEQRQRSVPEEKQIEQKETRPASVEHILPDTESLETREMNIVKESPSEAQTPEVETFQEAENKEPAVIGEETPVPEEMPGSVEKKAETFPSVKTPVSALEEAPPVIAEVSPVTPVVPSIGDEGIEGISETAEAPPEASAVPEEEVSAEGEKEPSVTEKAAPPETQTPEVETLQEAENKEPAVIMEETPAPEEMPGSMEEKAETFSSGETPVPALEEAPPSIGEVNGVQGGEGVTTEEAPIEEAAVPEEGVPAEGEKGVNVAEKAAPSEAQTPEVETLQEAENKEPAVIREETPAPEEMPGSVEEKASVSPTAEAGPEQGDEIKGAGSTEVLADETGIQSAGSATAIPGIALIIPSLAVPSVPGAATLPSAGAAGSVLPGKNEEVPEKEEGLAETVMPEAGRQEMPEVRKRQKNDNMTVTYNNRVAVLPFENLSGDMDAVRHITPLIVDHMEKKGFSVVGQEGLNDYLCKGRVRSTGYVTGEIAAKIQREFNASTILAGSVISFSDDGDAKFGILARLIDASDGQILWANFAAATGKDFTTVLELGTLTSASSLIPIVMERLFSSLDIEKLFRDIGPSHRVAVMPFRNNSQYSNAGMIAMHMFVIELLKSRDIRPVEYGLIRNSMVHLKIKNRGELSYRDIHGLYETLDAEEILIGVVDEYSEGVNNSTPPKVSITARLINSRNNKIVWYNSGQLTGEDNIIVLDWGRIRSVHAVAYQMVSKLVKTIEKVQ